ncbi:hypothetical protein NMY22_g9625 [Coprinellus aureogranulatus]|nr:hypothetical protein NMY22_g9625 [Coprinellus aureogranulatus]
MMFPPGLLASFCEHHPKVKTVRVPTHWDMTRFTHTPETLPYRQRGVEITTFDSLRALDPCLGAWPPGANDDGGVDDPFWFDV